MLIMLAFCQYFFMFDFQLCKTLGIKMPHTANNRPSHIQPKMVKKAQQCFCFFNQKWTKTVKYCQKAVKTGQQWSKMVNNGIYVQKRFKTALKKHSNPFFFKWSKTIEKGQKWSPNPLIPQYPNTPIHWNTIKQDKTTTHRQTDRHINTMNRPGLRAGPIENTSTIQKLFQNLTSIKFWQYCYQKVFSLEHWPHPCSAGL